MRTALKFLGLMLAVAILAHVAAMWALPRLVMWKTMDMLQDLAGGKPNAALRPDLPDHTARTVVMPSPDLLYVICVYDLARGPVLLSADRFPPGYWSLALYDARSDNFLTINDRQQLGRPLALVITETTSPPGDARFVASPSTRGIALFRSLLLDPAERETIDAARATMQCQPVR